MKVRGYGFIHAIYLLCSWVVTKIAFPKSRIIRLPFFFRNHGHLDIGARFSAGRSLRLDVHEGGTLIVGTDVQINDHCQIACASKITIGDDVMIASKVFITDHDHDFRDHGAPRTWSLNSDDVTIGDGCWVGNGVHILKGVSLGEGTVVGAGSVVIKSTPPFSIIMGSPARVVLTRTVKNDLVN
jgi:lipopolysaccharide O-acetyltransferase